jgi:hypothetical protein
MTVEQRMLEVRAIGESVCDALRNEVLKIGLPDDCIDPDIYRAEYSLSLDPASGQDSLIGIWRDSKGHKQGEILFHADGSFFAEYDVISAHPKKKQWFVEAVTAWGREDIVKAEPRLLPFV